MQPPHQRPRARDVTNRWSRESQPVEHAPGASFGAVGVIHSARQPSQKSKRLYCPQVVDRSTSVRLGSSIVRSTQLTQSGSTPSIKPGKGPMDLIGLSARRGIIVATQASLGPNSSKRLGSFGLETSERL